MKALFKSLSIFLIGFFSCYVLCIGYFRNYQVENSLKNFTLNDLEKDVIVKHMWPLTIKFPKYKESYIVTFVDKYCATVEFFKYLNKKYKLRMVYRYAYIFLTILFVRF